MKEDIRLCLHATSFRTKVAHGGLVDVPGNGGGGGGTCCMVELSLVEKQVVNETCAADKARILRIHVTKAAAER